jgi:hypothetical protein
MGISIIERVEERQQREVEEDHRVYLEIPPPPIERPKKETKREPKRVIEIQL